MSGLIEPECQTRGIRMSSCRFDLPCFVHADRTRLKQVVINLLSNALKYNRAAGSVTVECTTTTPERVRISVRDTGAGLPPTSWRSCSSRSIVLDRKPVRRKVAASASS